MLIMIGQAPLRAQSAKIPHAVAPRAENPTYQRIPAWTALFGTRLVGRRGVI